MKKQDLQTTEHNEYIGRYLAKIDGNTDLKKGYEADKNKIIDFFTQIPKDKLEHSYEPEKWTIKEVLQHMIDTERIFMYRLLCIARNDKTSFPDYDQNIYIQPSEANKKSLDTLVTEFTCTRNYSINLINSLSEANLKNMGTVSGSSISARVCAFLILGHNNWHMEIIKDRYLLC